VARSQAAQLVGLGPGPNLKSELGAGAAVTWLQSNMGKAIANPQLKSNSLRKGGAGPHF